MLSEEASCSDCKLEIIQLRWTQLLLNWINKCVKNKKKPRIDQIDMKTLHKIAKKYKDDISTDSKDKDLLSSNKIGPFIKYKYPIVQLDAATSSPRKYKTPKWVILLVCATGILNHAIEVFYIVGINLSEPKDEPKKLYIMASILLFHCCVSSQTGKVHADICSELDKRYQEMILRYCEVLRECEVSVSNIDNAIRVACESLEPIKKILKTGCGKGKTSKPISYAASNDSMKSMTTNQTETGDKKKVTIQEGVEPKNKEKLIKFKFSITVPTVITDTSSNLKASADHYSDFSAIAKKINKPDEEEVVATNSKETTAVERVETSQDQDTSQKDSGDKNINCEPECPCTKCISSGPCCGDIGISVQLCEETTKKSVRMKKFKDMPIQRLKYLNNWKLYVVLAIGILLAISLLFTIWMMPSQKQKVGMKWKRSEETVSFYMDWAWECKKNLCQKVFQITSNSKIYKSLNRCNLICMGPLLWPYPIGFTYFSKTVVGLATNKLEYKFLSVPSDIVQQYLSEAFKLFIKDLVTLEKTGTKPKNGTDLKIKKMNIQIEVDTDAGPRMRLDTDETYSLKMDLKGDQLIIRISAASFCGVRHGLETLSQIIVLDETSGYLMTVSKAVVKDGPSFKYRGLMIDTGRNFIPVKDLMRTVDGMAACKLNTLHWRISDVVSFPLEVPELPELMEYGPYDRSMVYSKEDIKLIVNRAGIRGIRVLIEVALPGPVGRPWSWSPQATCLKKSVNHTCDNVACLRLKINEPVFDALQIIYSEILDLTKVDDVFHLSDGVFSISNCFSLLEDREGFLDKALERLTIANGGFLPKLPIVWYTAHLSKDFEAKTWERFGVQLYDWDPSLSYQYLSKFKVIHSAKWDLSCQMKNKRCTKYRTWQEMYSRKTWRNMEVFTVEGGEAVLWTDLVDSGNLDYHLWPRTVAVAERLWSDVVANSTADRFVYTRLDAHRWRMQLRGVQVQPIWPAWCSLNPSACLDKT